MARLAVFASGRGSNFIAIAGALAMAKRHAIEFVLCDVKGAPVLDRAQELGIPVVPVSYRGVTREAVEKKIVRHLERRRVDLVALAGYMKLLTPWFIHAFKGPVINLHPSLLPKYPGAHAIEESYRSGDKELGISVMRIDEGVDTGPVLLQKSFVRTGAESLEEIEAGIHKLEHEWFPRVLIGLLDDIDSRTTPGRTP
ncbi:MAG: phosphoribosylglycinamide formyltransferase [Spirochaetia bacterium]|jgi:phosphoribosylglycinamide formyltransferase-1